MFRFRQVKITPRYETQHNVKDESRYSFSLCLTLTTLYDVLPSLAAMAAPHTRLSADAVSVGIFRQCIQVRFGPLPSQRSGASAHHPETRVCLRKGSLMAFPCCCFFAWRCKRHQLEIAPIKSWRGEISSEILYNRQFVYSSADNDAFTDIVFFFTPRFPSLL